MARASASLDRGSAPFSGIRPAPSRTEAAPRARIPPSPAAARPGAGWRPVGFRPGPALAVLGTGWPEALVFTAAMLVGMILHRFATPTARAA